MISRWVEADGPRMVSRYEWTTEDGMQHKTMMWDLALAREPDEDAPTASASGSWL